jgi:hypothetical protein
MTILLKNGSKYFYIQSITPSSASIIGLKLAIKDYNIAMVQYFQILVVESTDISLQGNLRNSTK